MVSNPGMWLLSGKTALQQSILSRYDTKAMQVNQVHRKYEMKETE